MTRAWVAALLRRWSDRIVGPLGEPFPHPREDAR